MLQFVLGRASSGKTEKIYELATKQNVDECIIIVPEQFTFETERNLLRKGYGNYNVLSFTRLIDTVRNTYGGSAGDTLGNFDKVIIMLRALSQAKESLAIYKNYCDYVDFAAKLIKLSDELKESAVTLDQLQNSINKIKVSSTKNKVKELVAILLEYNAIISKEFLDPADELQRLYETINSKNFFKDKCVYFDGFKSFSNAQIKILRCALRDAKNVTISFCCDPLDMASRRLKIFSNVYNIIDKISREANNVNCKIVEPILLEKSFYVNEDLAFFEKHIFNNDGEVFLNNAENVAVMHSKSPSDMIDEVLLMIHRLVRVNGYKYSDFVIVSRDINKYDRYLSAYSEKYDIPVFFDKRKSLKYSPISRFVISAINAAITLKSDNIFEFLKSGFNLVSDYDVALLEDYVFLWKIDGDTWLNSWNMSVKGLDEFRNEEEKENGLKKLEKINEIRQKVIEPIVSLKYSLTNNPSKNCEAIYNFIVRLGVNKLLEQYIKVLEEDKNFKQADFCKASYEPFMDLLSSLHKCFKNFEMQPKKFLELLSHTIANKTIGTIPQMIDEVSCGSADRIRPARPKVVFVIGLNQYEFPATISDSDLLLNTDRKELISCDIDIVDKFITYLHNENFLLYSSSCCSSEKVFLCSCSNAGETMPTSLVNNTLNAFPNCNRVDLSNIEDKIETKDNSFSILAELNPKFSEYHEPLTTYYKETEYNDKLGYLNSTLEVTDTHLSKDFTDRNFNHDVNMSASRIDLFYKCKFSYFCKYILNLKTKKVAEVDTMNRGTMVHYVLEQSIKKYGINLANFNKSDLDNLVDDYLNEYLTVIKAEKLLEDNRFKFIFNKIAALTKKTIYRVAEEFKNTEFNPTYCEYSIGEDIPPLQIQGKNKINITGFIDRVDIFHSRVNDNVNYVRIVDYKSGNLKININNILYGLNLQMLIYLYAFHKNYDKEFCVPAGIFYLPANGGYNQENPKMKMSGIVPNDPRLYYALDRSGEFIPTFSDDKTRKENPQIDVEDFYTLFEYVNHKIVAMESEILDGNFEARPYEQGLITACTYCDFKNICRIEDKRKFVKIDTSKNTEEALEYMRCNCDDF